MPELGGSPGEAAADHLRGCPACAAAMRDQRVLEAGLRGFAAECGRLKAPGRMEGKLRAAFRGQLGLASPPRQRFRWAPAIPWAAAAALVTVALLLVAARNRQEQPPAHRAVPVGVAELASLNWTADLPAGDSSAAEDKEFVPLPNADRLPPIENTNLVRVEVPRSAMIALGYTVTADRASELVRADVVLGSDGLARAVRFLDE
jgi:hypothetical protein